MTALELRNCIVNRLHQAMGRPVLLHDQQAPETQPPYLYYQMIAPFLPLGGGNREFNGAATTQTEHTDATISITAASYDRDDPDGERIYGDDEALYLAERAFGWFNLAGRSELLRAGIDVISLGNVTNRTALMVDAVARQYGFDVRLRYLRTDRVPTPALQGGLIRHND